MLTDAQRRPRSKYARTKLTRKTIDFFPTEVDILQRFEDVKQNGEGITKYIKRLIREDIKKSTNKPINI